jgi:predicted transcriptional regulator with HTH domain
MESELIEKQQVGEESALEKPELEDWQIVTLLRKSRIRKEVLGLLFSSDEVNASVISKKLGYALCDVCRVLHGLPSRYKKENPLVAIELVEEIIKVRGYSNGMTFYRVTDKGRYIYEKYCKLMEAIK